MTKKERFIEKSSESEVEIVAYRDENRRSVHDSHRFHLTSPVRNAISSVTSPSNLARGMIAMKFSTKVAVGPQKKCETMPKGMKINSTFSQEPVMMA